LYLLQRGFTKKLPFWHGSFLGGPAQIVSRVVEHDANGSAALQPSVILLNLPISSISTSHDGQSARDLNEAAWVPTTTHAAITPVNFIFLWSSCLQNVFIFCFVLCALCFVFCFCFCFKVLANGHRAIDDNDGFVFCFCFCFKVLANGHRAIDDNDGFSKNSTRSVSRSARLPAKKRAQGFSRGLPKNYSSELAYQLICLLAKLGGQGPGIQLIQSRSSSSNLELCDGYHCDTEPQTHRD